MNKMIEMRYKNCLPSIRLTLKRIVPTKRFQSLKNTLRSQGWKDWHILMGIFNFVMNYRMEKLEILGNQQAMIKFYETYPYQEEDEKSICTPLNEFTEENIRIALELSMLATIRAIGFDLPKNTAISKDKLRKILDGFNYWEDDVEHEPIFEIES